MDYFADVDAGILDTVFRTLFGDNCRLLLTPTSISLAILWSSSWTSPLQTSHSTVRGRLLPSNSLQNHL